MGPSRPNLSVLSVSVLLLLCCFAVACAPSPSTERETVASPGIGKADGADVTSRGNMEFDNFLSGSFTRDNQFDAYTFRAAADALVSIEVTLAGTARDLDTTLFLYGPLDTGAMDEIAWDDNSGQNQLSSLPFLRLREAGEYMVVVGTREGNGRGKYTLALWCEGDVCSAQDAPDTTDDPDPELL